MRFAHIADCHIGGWHEPKMRELSDEAFIKAVDIILEKKADFLLVSGDLFNTSLPAMDSLKMAVRQLQRLKNAGVPVYIIAGSHDFSPTGKTMIDVLCEAELCVNVVKADKERTAETGKLSLKFTDEKNTGIRIAGMLGKRGMLERLHYEDLDRSTLEEEKGPKIFMFHTAITELKPTELERMDSSPISLLPRGFDYYAGGHVHIIENRTIDGYRNVVYPGPVFPNSFSELEKLGSGGMFIVDSAGNEDSSAIGIRRLDAVNDVDGGDGEGGNDGKGGNLDDSMLTLKPTYLQIPTHPVVRIEIDCKGITSEQLESELSSAVAERNFTDAVVLMRITGRLESGRLADIDFRGLFDSIYSKGAYFIMKNTSGVKTLEIEDVRIKAGSAEDIENRLIDENSGKYEKEIFADREKDIIRQLMRISDCDKDEGEKVFDFESRIVDELNSILAGFIDDGPEKRKVVDENGEEKNN